MRRYETFVIVDPDLSDEQREPVFDRITELIPQQGGLLVKIENWGNKKLAYEINKRVRGHYSRIDYCGSGPLIDEMERFFRIDDRVLKYMTVLLDKQVDPESIQAEIAKEKEQENQPLSVNEPEAEQPPSEASETETEQDKAEHEADLTANNKEES